MTGCPGLGLFWLAERFAERFAELFAELSAGRIAGMGQSSLDCECRDSGS